LRLRISLLLGELQPVPAAAAVRARVHALMLLAVHPAAGSSPCSSAAAVCSRLYALLPASVHA
ncbi:hypothetical protein PFISCL1PPCAC_2187, partial [Pristionchus fissidentatus]